MRSLACALLLLLAAPAYAGGAVEEPIETPIPVPSPIPVGFLVAWKPTILSVRIDSGVGAQFGSDKFQALRGLGRYTGTFFGDKLMWRAELEGGQFQTDTQNTHIGTDGVDLTGRILGGTATRISEGFTVTASAGLLSRYQWGTQAQGGAPRLGVFGATSNVELEYRVAPILTVSFYLEGGLTPFAYGTQPNLGVLSDASEFRFRLQVSMDLSPNAAVDLGYDFTRWHGAFSGSTVLGNSAPDQALLIEQREQALTLGFRWKP